VNSLIVLPIFLLSIRFLANRFLANLKDKPFASAKVSR